MLQHLTRYVILWYTSVPESSTLDLGMFLKSRHPFASATWCASGIIAVNGSVQHSPIIQDSGGHLPMAQEQLLETHRCCARWKVGPKIVEDLQRDVDVAYWQQGPGRSFAVRSLPLYLYHAADCKAQLECRNHPL